MANVHHSCVESGLYVVTVQRLLLDILNGLSSHCHFCTMSGFSLEIVVVLLLKSVHLGDSLCVLCRVNKFHLPDDAECSVSGIAEASASALAGIREASESVAASVADELKAVRAELEATRRAYDEQAQRYKSLDEAISRAYALCGGDVAGFALHDEQRSKSTFKLNI
jgi:predicted phosphoribosyltransferase